MYLQFNKKNGKNGKTYHSVLLCEKYRKDGAIKTKVVMNLSKLPSEMITALKTATNKTKGILIDSQDVKINYTIDYGYIFIILQFIERLRIRETLNKVHGPKTNLILLMIVGKLITQGSKLCIYNWIKRHPFIADKLSIDIKTLKVDDLYCELGELSLFQDKIEKKWNLYHKKRHQDIYLYDITSVYFEGTKNDLAAFGYNRDGKKGKMQITVGLITDSNGFPLKIEVFKGNVNDHTAVQGQLEVLKESFNADRITLVGDRGMRIRMNLEDMGEEQRQGIYYISALTKPEILALIEKGTIQLSLFAKDLIEVESQGVRYVLSTNPLLEEQKHQLRDSLKQRFEQETMLIKQGWKKRKEQNEKNIEKLKQGHKNKKLKTSFSEKDIDNYKFRTRQLLKQCKMSKFYSIEITTDTFDTNFKMDAYQEQRMLDGKYIVESTVPKAQMNTDELRSQYKALQNVEHGFRDLKTERINIRPVYHRNELQTRGHVFVCMFAYAITKEMETLIFPWLKMYNKENKCNLSFADIEDELRNIKLSELELGHRMKKIMIPELNPIQKEVLEILKTKPEQIMTTM